MTAPLPADAASGVLPTLGAEIVPLLHAVCETCDPTPCEEIATCRAPD